MVRASLTLVLAFAAVAVLPSNVPEVPSPSTAFWSAHIEPLLTENCSKCHGGVKQKGGLDLRTVESILKGGDTGPALVPGSPEDSLLFRLIQPGADPHMPPEEKQPLTDSQIQLIKLWIETLNPTGVVASQQKSEPAEWPQTTAPANNAAPRLSWSPPPNMPPSRVIDRFIEIGWDRQNASEHVAGRCSDSTFVRRVYLDLAGRIPTRKERNAFLQSKEPRKRAALVDALLGSDDYVAHMRDIFDFVLMERRGPEVTSQRRKNHWFDFLETAFRENRPWNEMVRELIVARPEAPDNRGAVWFLYERKNNHQLMAEAVAPVAFGMQVKCAQCHDHPLVPEIGQRHYWGLVAAFNRTKNVDVAGGPALAESAIGGFVNFTNLKKESQPALLEFLNGITVSETRPADGEKEEDSPEKYLIPPPPEKEKPTQASVPKFSRRNALADSVTRENPLLARAFVNRAWAMLIGRGLVHPVDEIDSKHPPTHPGLLDWLSRDFEENGYDIKRLFRILVLSRVYQLDFRPTQTVPIPPETFVRALEKPLSAEVLYRSWVTATGHQPDSDGRIAGHSEEELREAFIAQFPDLFPLEYNATLQQALFLANNPLLDTLLEPRANNTTAQLIALPDSQARVRRAFLAVLGRRPDSDELSHSAKFLEGREIKAGAKQLLWALLSSAEFQLNH